MVRTDAERASEGSKKKASRKNALIPRILSQTLSKTFTRKKPKDDVINVSSGSEPTDDEHAAKQRVASDRERDPISDSWDQVDEAVEYGSSLAKVQERLHIPQQSAKRRKKANKKKRKLVSAGGSSPAGSGGEGRIGCKEASPSYSGVVVDIESPSPSDAQEEAELREPAGNEAEPEEGEPVSRPLGSPKASKYFSASGSEQPAVLRKRKKKGRKNSDPGRVNTQAQPPEDSNPGADKQEPSGASQNAGAALTGAVESRELIGQRTIAHGGSDAPETISKSRNSKGETKDAEIFPSWFQPNRRSERPEDSTAQQSSGGTAAPGDMTDPDEPRKLGSEVKRQKISEIGTSRENHSLKSPIKYPSAERRLPETAFGTHEGQKLQDFHSSLFAKQQDIREGKRRAAATVQTLLSPPKREKQESEGLQTSRSPIPLSPLEQKQRLPGVDSPYNANMRIALWEPPVSPYSLIEEAIYNDPWKLLVACMLLNKTTGKAVRKILWRLFELVPTPEAAADVDSAAVEQIIKPLGLFRKRAVMFKRFSQEYAEMEWSDPQQLHGIGKYAADAYFIFCRNQWRERPPPQDKDLLKYYEWLKSTGGEGQGYEREVFSAPQATSVDSKGGNSSASDYLSANEGEKTSGTAAFSGVKSPARA